MPKHQNHAEGCDCGCDKFGGHTLAANLASGHRYVEHLGRRTLVVPVVMARADVVMNECLVPAGELFSLAWNGVPVTVRHPATRNGSANDPAVIEEYSVGTIFNSTTSNGSLKAEAWIDVERADKVYPGLVTKLESGEPMDVSTGYFSKDTPKAGVLNGRSYKTVSSELKPDHLALLPDEVGACNWDDGCGVRANTEEKSVLDKIRGLLSAGKRGQPSAAGAYFAKSAALAAMDAVARANARSTDPDNPLQITCDLIACDDTPFTPEDFYSLSNMSPSALMTLRDDYLPDDDGQATTDANNAEGGQSVADKDNDAATGLPKTVAELNAFVANSIKSALAPLMAPLLTEALAPITEAIKANALSDADKSALARATKINDDHRESLITKITTNSDMKKETIEKWDTAQLEIVANGLKVAVANYAGRGMPLVPEAPTEALKPVISAMVPVSLGERIRANAAKSKEMN